MVDTFTTALRPGTPVYSQNLTKYVRAALLETLRAGLVHIHPTGVDKSAYARGTNDNYVLPGVGDLGVSLIEEPTEISPPAIEELESYVYEFSTKTYHRALGYSADLVRTQPFDAGSTVADRLTRAAALAMDEVARLAWNATNPDIPVLGDGTAELTTDDLINAVAALRGLDVPDLGGGDGGLYGAIIHPWALASLKREIGEKSWNAANLDGGAPNLMTGYLGQWQGIQFYGSSRVGVTGTAPALSSVTTVFGANALAFADVGSLSIFHVPPTASLVDPTARKGVVSYLFRGGAGLIPRQKYAGDDTPTYNVIRLVSKTIDPLA